MTFEIILFLRKIKSFILSKYYLVLSFFYTQEKFKIYKNNFLLLPGCEDNKNSLELQFYHGNLTKLDRPINYYYEQLYNEIKKRVDSKLGGAIIRASDGEAYFLAGKLVGNGPRRHYTKKSKLRNDDLNMFREGLLACDSRHIEMLKNNQKAFLNIFGRNIFSEIPFECIYALISSRKLLKSNYKIGIIGSDKKIEIIKELLKHNQYCDYIGRTKFDDYIGIPEIGSSNDPISLSKIIKKQLNNNIDIYLVGIGIAKLVILPELSKDTTNLFLDVGAGISALAGLISNDRPYFANWKNFRLKNFDYSRVDIMDFDKQKDNFINL